MKENKNVFVGVVRSLLGLCWYSAGKTSGGVCVCFLSCFVPVLQSSARMVPVRAVSQLELPLKTAAPREIKAAVCVCAVLIFILRPSAASGIVPVACGDSSPAVSPSLLRVYPIMFVQCPPPAPSPLTLYLLP